MTQNERILAILADGDWHEKSEFYGFCVLHSRISELRHDHGYTIDKEHRGGKVFYRLASLSDSATGDHGASPAESLSESGVGQLAESSAGDPFFSDAANTCDRPPGLSLDSRPVLERRLAPQQLTVFEDAA